MDISPHKRTTPVTGRRKRQTSLTEYYGANGGYDDEYDDEDDFENGYDSDCGTAKEKKKSSRGSLRASMDMAANHKCFLLLMMITCAVSLFVSFYVDIKILDLLDDPAYFRWTTVGANTRVIEVPASAARHFNMRPQELQKLLNLTGKPTIVVEGDFNSHSGIAIANNNMKASLACNVDGTGGVKSLPFNIRYEQLEYVESQKIQPRLDVQVTIRSGTWLPLMIPGLIPSKGWLTKGMFIRPDDSLLVYQLPWEFTVIPDRWVKVLDSCVDRLWVPSYFVRDAYVDSGLSPDIIDVVPHAINDSMWSPLNKPYKFPTKKKFVFLFVSGMLHRKGIDVLLEAYSQAFTADDDVTLYLHSAYSGESRDGELMGLQILADIDTHTKAPGAPEIVLDSEKKLSEEDYFGLYTGADAYVLPFRGEGFALTVFEAALSSLPIITTKASPITDFLTDETAYLVPSTLEPCSKWPCSATGMFDKYNGGRTAKPPEWWLPDVDKLSATLRDVFHHQDAAKKKGQRARTEMLAALGLAGRRQPYVEAFENLVAHRAKPGFVPKRATNPSCTSAADYVFVEDELSQEDKDKFNNLAQVYKETGLAVDVKRWLNTLYDSNPTPEELEEWKAAQDPKNPTARGANIGLTTFPNSGTSWTLNLLKGATGVLKHTMYDKECDQEFRGMFCVQSRRGFAINETGDEPGRLPRPHDPILVKTHMALYGLKNKKLPNVNTFIGKLQEYGFDRIVRLVRHPLDNFIARLNLEVNNNRCEQAKSIFECLGANFFIEDMERYFAWHRALEAAAHDLNLPMITVIYEDLLSDTEPRLKRLLQFMAIHPPEEQVKHATMRWKPIHTPDQDGLPGYLLKYDAYLLRNISVVFHKFLERDFRGTTTKVGEWLQPAQHKTASKKKKRPIMADLKKLHGNPKAKDKAKQIPTRTYGVAGDYHAVLAKVVQQAIAVQSRKIQRTTESMAATCNVGTQTEASKQGMIPQVFFVGSSRSGLRSLYDLLRRHQQAVKPICRDSTFFSNVDLFQKGKAWYKALYDPSSAGSESTTPFAVDVSVADFEKPNVPHRVAHHAPDIGIGIMLRNPAHQFISKWLQKVEARSKDIDTFETQYGKPYDCMNVFEQQLKEVEACNLNPLVVEEADWEAQTSCLAEARRHNNDIAASLYAYSLHMWLQNINNPSQYFILQSEEFFEHPAPTAQRLAMFAEVAPFDNSTFHVIHDIGHDRFAHVDMLMAQYDYKGCPVSKLNAFFQPFNSLLKRTIQKQGLSPLTNDTWTHW